ncbi:MAG: glycogen debranching enzyme N-terminal domain-containing protein [Polyangiaceae bacterium]
MKVRPGGDYRPSRDGPFPSIETNGELGPAEREWLHTNGAGAYSMSTIAFMHTRAVTTARSWPMCLAEAAT